MEGSEGKRELEKLRPPGRLERYNIARNHLRFYNNVGMTASYEIPEKQLKESSLQKLTFLALRGMIDRHPVLSISIIDEDSLTPSWVRLPEIDLRKVVSFHNLGEQATEHDSERIIEAAHQVPFEDLEELPLWRLVVIEHSAAPGEQSEIRTIDVGFFWHHSIGDGGSGFAFHLEFLDALNLTIETDAHCASTEATVIPPKHDLLPSIEQAHRLPVTLFFMLRQILKALLPSRKDELLWTGPPIRSERNITHLQTLYLPAAIVNALVRRCRENNVTFTALLTVTIARILARFHPDYRHFKGKNSVSFRRFTGTDPRSMVCYVSAISHMFSSTGETGYIDCGESFTWSAVKACKREIDASTKTPKNHMIGLLKFVKDYGKWLQTRLGLQRSETFEVSNVGVMDGGLHDENKIVKIRRVLFSQSSNVIGPSHVFNVATAKGGDLAIGLTWQDGIIDIEVAKKVLVSLDSELRGLAKQ